jgi:hypothetical protein
LFVVHCAAGGKSAGTPRPASNVAPIERIVMLRESSPTAARTSTDLLAFPGS